MGSAVVVQRIALEDTKAIRTEVLRRGTPSREANYDGDSNPQTVHLGAVSDGAIVATSTWLRAPWPNDSSAVAVQLRGMAVLDSFQGKGIGRLLVMEGIEHARSLDARYVWAKARDTAIAFYEGCGFVVVGEQFTEPASGLPHHLVLLDLERTAR